jgi:hypothetical protein
MSKMMLGRRAFLATTSAAGAIAVAVGGNLVIGGNGACVVGIYNNPEVWPIFGYEGESAAMGGYINRGFDDISWLKDA